MNAFGWAWIAAIVAAALHVADEAAHDFLTWYNPQALRIRRLLGDFPFPPTFAFWPWLIALSLAVIVLAALTPQVVARTRWVRPLAIIIAAEHIGNGLLHFAADVATRRAVPGIWSAPLLMITGLWLFFSL